jgi:hypothetical protein
MAIDLAPYVALGQIGNPNKNPGNPNKKKFLFGLSTQNLKKSRKPKQKTRKSKQKSRKFKQKIPKYKQKRIEFFV